MINSYRRARRTDNRANFNSNRWFYYWTSDFGEYLEGMAGREQDIEVKTVADLLDEIADETLYRNGIPKTTCHTLPLVSSQRGTHPLPTGIYQDTVNFRTMHKSFKSKKRLELPQEEGQIFKNTHPAIIDEEAFMLVQELREHRRRPTRSGIISVYSGMCSVLKKIFPESR